MLELVVAVVAAVIAAVSAAIAWRQARDSERAARRADLAQLFSAFHAGNEATIANPDLLYSVHGLDPEVPEAEASRIAYLSTLLDGFQYYYGAEYGGDFSQMASELESSSTFLNRLLAVPDNQKRWEWLKRSYYGGSDRSFVRAVDRLIDFENRRRGSLLGDA